MSLLLVLHLLTSSRDVLTRNMLTYNTALTSIALLYERLVYRSYGLRGSKDDDDKFIPIKDLAPFSMDSVSVRSAI